MCRSFWRFVWELLSSILCVLSIAIYAYFWDVIKNFSFEGGGRVRAWKHYKTTDFTDPVSGGLCPYSLPPWVRLWPTFQNSEKSFLKKEEGEEISPLFIIYVLTFCNICGYIRGTELFSRICNLLIFFLDSSWLKGLDSWWLKGLDSWWLKGLVKLRIFIDFRFSWLISRIDYIGLGKPVY